MTRGAKITTALSTLATIAALWQFCHEPVNNFIHKVNDISSSMDSVRMVRKTQLQIIGKQSENQSFNLIIYKDQAILDKKIDLLLRGKFPYDSIALKSKSGHWYKTTIKDELNLHEEQ